MNEYTTLEVIIAYAVGLIIPALIIYAGYKLHNDSNSVQDSDL